MSKKITSLQIFIITLTFVCLVGVGFWTPAFAQAPEKQNGWYLGVGGAVTDRGKVHEENDSRTTLTFTTGLNLNTVIGYRLRDFRIEGEASFYNNEIDEATAFTGVVVGTGPARGNVSLFAYMLNFYYDIPFTYQQLHPYIGGGIGFYQSRLDGLRPGFFQDGPSVGAPQPDITQGNIEAGGLNGTSDLPFAYQIKAGLNYLLSEKTEVYLGYRYFHGNALEFNLVPPWHNFSGWCLYPQC
jgi:opacity protein-like surface antigen